MADSDASNPTSDHSTSGTPTSDHSTSVTANRRGRVGHLHLNRPQALNALTLEMIQRIHGELSRWAEDDSVELVLITGEGDRAFCAGADVKSVYFAGKSGERGRDGTLPADLFRHEYAMNHAIANFPKPYVAFWDGVTMGGGVGVSVMGSHRIATERTQFAMPETGIGLFPDVGGSYFLSRLGPIGWWLGLTGQTIDAAMTIAFGLATHFIPSNRGQELIDAIAQRGVDAISALAVDPPHNEEIEIVRAMAQHCFAHRRIEEVMTSLQDLSIGDTRLSNLASQTYERLRERSPMSLKLVMEQLHRGATMTFADCLVMEYRLSQACMDGHDFYEGIRAVLVDKDRQPKWDPPSIEQVSDEAVEACFRELGARELGARELGARDLAWECKRKR